MSKSGVVIQPEPTSEKPNFHPPGVAPPSDAIKACRAMRAWFICEDRALGSLDARMNLSALAQHLARKALGHQEKFRGVPRIEILPGPEAVRVVPSEEEVWALVEECERMECLQEETLEP